MPDEDTADMLLRLYDFYSVETPVDLIKMQEQHIRKLQKKLKEKKPYEYPASYRR